jgi:hypothetical protein
MMMMLVSVFYSSSLPWLSHGDIPPHVDNECWKGPSCREVLEGYRVVV